MQQILNLPNWEIIGEMEPKQRDKLIILLIKSSPQQLGSLVRIILISELLQEKSQNTDILKIIDPQISAYYL